MEICLLLQDICLDGSGIDLEEILAKGGLKSFVSTRFSRDISTSSAIEIFNRRGYKGIASTIQDLRESHKVNLSFITPLGVIHSQQIIVKYNECIQELSKDRLDYFLSVNEVEAHVQRILEERPDLVIFFMKHGLWKHLNLIDYIPVDSLSLFISNVPPRFERTSIISLSEIYLKRRDIKNFGTFLKHLSNFLLDRNRKREEITKKELEQVVRDVSKGKEKKSKNLLKVLKGA